MLDARQKVCVLTFRLQIVSDSSKKTENETIQPYFTLFFRLFIIQGIGNIIHVAANL